MLHARVMTFNGAKNIDDGAVFVREKALPVVREQPGYAGLTVSADRDGGVLGILSLWESEADRTASESGLNAVRQEGLGVVGGELSIENFEEVFVEIGATPPGPGAALLLQRAKIDPAKLNENLEYFAKEVAPRIMANDGFRALRQLVNRATGDAIVGTVWSDAATRKAALAQGEARRSEAVARGVTFGEMSEREVLFVDMPS
jgi:heme-degrading monooxygenase HmoA